MRKIKVGIIGVGRMGEMYLNEMLKSEQWEIVYICDLSPISREKAKEKSLLIKVFVLDSIVCGN